MLVACAPWSSRRRGGRWSRPSGRIRRPGPANCCSTWPPAASAAPICTCSTARSRCRGFIGHRALRMAGDAERLGLYGFGASAHLITQVAVWEQRRVFAFTRAGDERTQAFARSLGAEWAGAAGDAPPEPLDAAIIFA